MGRRVNSFGYRLGITHFWKFQDFLHFPIKGYNILANNLINQLVFTTFSYNGFKVLFTTVVSRSNILFIDVKILMSYFLDLKKFYWKNELLISFNNFIFNYFFLIFKLISNLKNLVMYKIKLFFAVKFLFLLNFYIFNIFFFIYFLINIYLYNFLKVLNNIHMCLKKFYLLKNIFKRKKKSFFSFYKLNIISKFIECKLRLLIHNKGVIVNSSYVYNLFSYFNSNTIKNLKKNLKGFWLIKQNLKLFEIIYFSCFFSLSSLMIDFLLDNISKKKKTHMKFLNFFFTMFESLYYQDLLYVSGIKVSIFGKIDAKMRKQKFFFFLGKINLTRLSCSISFTQKNLETRFGILGLRLWIKTLNDDETKRKR